MHCYSVIFSILIITLSESKHSSFGYSANQLHHFSLPIRHHFLLLPTSLLRIISSTQTDRTHLHDSSPTLSNTWQNWNSKQLIIVPYLLLSGFHQFKFVCPEYEITNRCSALTQDMHAMPCLLTTLVALQPSLLPNLNSPYNKKTKVIGLSCHAWARVLSHASLEIDGELESCEFLEALAKSWKELEEALLPRWPREGKEERKQYPFPFLLVFMQGIWGEWVYSFKLLRCLSMGGVRMGLGP